MNRLPVAPWVQDTRDENVFKEAFAGALLRHPNEPFKAASQVFPGDHIRAMTIAQQWVSDPFVLMRQTEMIKEYGDDHFLPTKVTLARRVYELGEDTKATKTEKLAAYKLYAELRGFMPEKGNTFVGSNVQVNNNRVMVVDNYGTDDQWEKSVKAQQAKLIEHNRD